MPNATDRRRATLFRRRGITFQNQASAIDEIERIVGEERIDCDFTGLDGYLFAPPDESSDGLEAELEAELEMFRRLGSERAEMVETTSIDAFDMGPVLRFFDQARTS